MHRRSRTTIPAKPPVEGNLVSTEQRSSFEMRGQMHGPQASFQFVDGGLLRRETVLSVSRFANSSSSVRSRSFVRDIDG